MDPEVGFLGQYANNWAVFWNVHPLKLQQNGYSFTNGYIASIKCHCIFFV